MITSIETSKTYNVWLGNELKWAVLVHEQIIALFYSDECAQRFIEKARNWDESDYRVEELNIVDIHYNA